MCLGVCVCVCVCVCTVCVYKYMYACMYVRWMDQRRIRNWNINGKANSDVTVVSKSAKSRIRPWLDGRWMDVHVQICVYVAVWVSFSSVLMSYQR